MEIPNYGFQSPWSIGVVRLDKKMIKYFILIILVLQSCKNSSVKEPIIQKKANSVMVFDDSFMEIRELSDGSIVQFKELSESEFNNFSKNITGKPIMYNDSLVCYNLLNGKVLVKSDDVLALFDNIHDINKLLADFEKKDKNGQEILFNKNKYNENFPEYSNLLVEQLCKALNIEMPAQFDYDFLVIIENRIARKESPKVFAMQNFLSIIALFGETLKNSNKTSNWKMNLSSDSVTWNPYYVINGKEYNFFCYLFEDIYSEPHLSKNFLTELFKTMQTIVQQK